LKVEIISGDQEADWVFQGVGTDPAFARVPLLLVDVGGGSTELILGQGEKKHFRQSLPLGAVRLIEQVPHSDPPASAELSACRHYLKEFFQKQDLLERAVRRERKSESAQGRLQLVGTGGTTSILARMEAQIETYDRPRIEATRLSLDRVRWHLRRLWRLPLEERKQIVGLPKNRADIILTGVAIYESIMEHFEFDVLRVSTRGLRFAAVMDQPASP
jgi:exopolyphosphatase/guanosine-5'-triphosphate,3'-diphosphate pyrophosphatase